MSSKWIVFSNHLVLIVLLRVACSICALAPFSGALIHLSKAFSCCTRILVGQACDHSPMQQ